MLWLVTGCSTGLGLSIANAVLAAGHECIASSRNPSNTPELVSDFKSRGGHWITLDVSGPDVETTIAQTISTHGPIDVLVNNAGYALAGPLENEPLPAARAMYETNVFGLLRTMQAVIPSMRARKSGTIVNISSAEAWAPNPLLSLYASSKWAVEGLTTSAAIELSPFGIRALLVEPDAIRTEFSNMARFDVDRFNERMAPYQGTFVDQVAGFIKTMHGGQQIDPDKAARAIVQEVTSPSSNPPLGRLPIGKESTRKLKEKVAAYKQIADSTVEIAASADFE